MYAGLFLKTFKISVTMRVICINNSFISGAGNEPELLCLLKEGETYTVVNTVNYGLGYILQEVEHPNSKRGFSVKRFIPLSNIDETEQEEVSDKVNIMVNS